jgi:hypothetical protein
LAAIAANTVQVPFPLLGWPCPNVGEGEHLTTRAKTALLSIIVAVGISLTPSSAWAADNTASNWSANSYTGFCGQVDGGYVVAAQEMLNTWGTYTGQIDNYWGPGTGNALVSYQASRGLSADGCAGPSTWSNMQALTVSFSHSSVCGATIGYYYRYLKSTRSSYFLRPDTGTRYWAAQANSTVGGPVAAGRYYRFSDNLYTYC